MLAIPSAIVPGLTPAAVTAPADALVVGSLKWWRGSDLRRLDLWGDDHGVTYLTIHDNAGRSTTFAYVRYADAEDDYHRIMDGSARVELRGDSSKGADERAAAVVAAIGRDWDVLKVLRGK